MLELDLALNAHRDAAAAEASGHRPLIIPVFYDSFKDGVDVQQMWQRRLEPGQGESNEEEAAVPAERQPWVHPERWAANLVMLKKRLQFLQLLRAAPAAKDEPLQVAKRVVAEAVKALPRQVDIGVDVVGAEQQEAELTAELCPGTEGVVALWLHGSGAVRSCSQSHQLGMCVVAESVHRPVEHHPAAAAAGAGALHLGGTRKIRHHRGMHCRTCCVHLSCTCVAVCFRRSWENRHGSAAVQPPCTSLLPHSILAAGSE